MERSRGGLNKKVQKEESWGLDGVLGNPAFRLPTESELNSTLKGLDGVQQVSESQKPQERGWRKSQHLLCLAVLFPHAALKQK